MDIDTFGFGVIVGPLMGHMGITGTLGVKEAGCGQRTGHPTGGMGPRGASGEFGYEVTDASVHDSQTLDGLLNKANTSCDVYADSAYRSVEIEAKLKARGFTSRIHRRATRNHPLSEAQQDANRRRSRTRARIEHVFGAQETAPGGRIVRTIGILRAKAKIGLQNLVYNARRLVTLERTAAA